MAFNIDVNGPDHTRIQDIGNLLNVAALTISCTYKGQEFFICGYYCENYIEEEKRGLYYDQQGELKHQTGLDVGHLRKRLVVDKPRITRKDIDWSGNVAQLEMDGGIYSLFYSFFLVPLNQMLIDNLKNNQFNQNQINNDNFGMFMNSNNFDNQECNMQNPFQQHEQNNYNIFGNNNFQ